MKLSTKSRYAIIALIDILENCSNGSAVSLFGSPESQNLPLAYLEQIFLNLRKNDIVKSSRGFNGGYQLSSEPSKLSIFSIVMAVDALKITHPCKGQSIGCIPHGAHCLTHQLWTALDSVMLEYLKKLTLQDVYSNTMAFITRTPPVKAFDEGCVYENTL